MMNAAVVDVMRSSSIALPDAYADSDKLARLATEVALGTGFENLALPFCMTLEAELKSLHDASLTEDVYRHPTKLRDTQMRIAEVEHELAQSNEEWEKWVS